jgi:hypothetical protein
MTKNINDTTFLNLMENIKLFSGDDLTQIAFDSKYRNVFLSITGYESDNYKLVIEELYNTNLKKEMGLTQSMKVVLQALILNEVKRQEKNIKDEETRTTGISDYEQFN